MKALNTTSNELDKRPIAITIICIMGFVGAALTIPMLFSEIALQIGTWFPPYSVFITAISLVCMIGLWFTKRWAAYVYFGLVVVNQLVLMTMGQWNILVLTVQGVIVITTLCYLDAKVKSSSAQFVRYIKRQIWAITVAYMLGIHNVYREEEKTPEDIVIVIEDVEKQENNTPKK